ncbi:MAG: hypothetical protein ACI4Q4_04215 [Oscillospiraceae bacterium]
MYAYIIDKIVKEVIPDIDPVFPDVDIKERYPADMLAKCVHVADDADVRVGMIYNADTGEFKEPEVVPISPMPEDIEGAKAYKITESKDKLAEWLANHPMTYKDGKQYSVTAEKQSLLNGNLSSYERAQGANPSINYPLKWNATGEECTEWEYEDLVSLSFAIAAYVAPKVAEQQATEIAINACSTIEELNGVVIAYE